MKTTTASKKHRDNGDMVARALRRHQDDLFEFAAQAGLPKNLKSKYRHLNPGQRRMLVGIRLRSLIQTDEDAKAVVRAALKRTVQ
jgi:hypothetical protein